MKILVPTDFSRNAQNALECALVIARKTGSEITLLHVCQLPVEHYSSAYPIIAEQTKNDMKAANEKAEEICQAISSAHSIACDNVVVAGSTREEIIKSAAVNHADLIIMATKGASGIDKVLFGSNTASVIEKAPCPVLAVPEKASTALPKKIAYATNYHDSDMQTLKELTKLTVNLSAELMILHVPKKKLRSEQELVEEFSRAVAKETGHTQPLHYALAHHDTQRGIELFVDSAEADWLALSTRKRSAFKKIFDSSLTKKLAYQARLPLLVYHATSVDDEDTDNEDFQ